MTSRTNQSSTQLAGLLRGITQKDMKQAMRKLLKNGWEAHVTNSTHVELRHPGSGAKLKVALTSGNVNAGKYLMRDARKAVKKAHRERTTR